MMFEAARLPKGTGTCMLYWSKPISTRISGVCLSRQDASALVESSPLSRPREIYLVISARPAANAGNARTVNGNRLRTPRGEFGKGPKTRQSTDDHTRRLATTTARHDVNYGLRQ